MLLGPQIGEQLGHPAVDGAEAMQARVARPTEGDQRGGPIGRPAVVNDERIRSAADSAEVMVARQDPFPAPAEAGPRAAAAVVAGLAQAAAVELPGAAGAAERQLLFEGGGHRAIGGVSPARR